MYLRKIIDTLKLLAIPGLMPQSTQSELFLDLIEPSNTLDDVRRKCGKNHLYKKQ